MEVSRHQVRFLETLQEKGVGFTVAHATLGQFFIKPSEMELFLSDPETFAARALGVDRNQYQQWSAFMSGWQCVGMTQAGQRCKSLANFGFRVSAKNFGASNENCYCPTHRRKVKVKKRAAP